MSASIFYRPLRGSQHIPVSTPSRFITAMDSVFGCQPWKLDDSSVPFLKGMASVSDDGAPYVAIMAKIAELGPIEVWPEW